MDIIKNFGIDPVLLTAQIVNFLILFFLLKRFAYKPIFKILSNRKKQIEEALKNSEDARHTLEKALDEEKQILKKAQQNAQVILTDAKIQAEDVLASAKDQTKIEVARMMDDAKRQLSQDVKEAELTLALTTAKLSVDITREALKNVFSEKDQEDIIEKMKIKLNVRK